MSTAVQSILPEISTALTSLIEHAGRAVVAVQSAAYRVVSGVVLNEELIAVTNHTLRREGTIPVHLPDGTKIGAEIMGRSASVDVAVLRVTDARLDPLPFAKKETNYAGALAVVVGRTLDAGLSTSLGIIGAAGPARRTWRGGSLDQFLRLDVNFYPSQAGAAVVNASGELIGMITPALSRHSSISIPVNTLNWLAEDFLREGKTRPGYVGIGVHSVSIPGELKAKARQAGDEGLMLVMIQPDSPAAEAGLKLGDIITAVNGTATAETEEAMRIFRRSAPGATVSLEILRAGEPLQLEVVVAESKNRA